MMMCLICLNAVGSNGLCLSFDKYSAVRVIKVNLIIKTVINQVED